MPSQMNQNERFLRERIDFINNLGVVGERRPIALVSSAVDSRLIEPDASGQHGLGVKIAGTSGTGKSQVLECTKKVQDPDSIVSISTASQKSVIYQAESWKNKAIIFAEALNLQSESDLLYHVRTLLSEGSVTHHVTTRIAGQFVTTSRTVKGPISLITTTTVESLEHQLESRLITISPDESSQQTERILRKTAQIAANGNVADNTALIKAWQDFHRKLKPALVVNPFAEKVAERIVAGTSLPISSRRSFKRLLDLVKAVAIFYQGQRQWDESGRIVAEMADYHMAHQMLSENFEEGISSHSDKDRERLLYIKEADEPLKIKDLVGEFGVSKNAVSKFLKRVLKDGLIKWCNPDGKAFETDTDLKTAKYSGNARIKAKKDSARSSVPLLPTAYEITGDEAWKEGGELAEMYDLALD
jgi:hypothetical protein